MNRSVAKLLLAVLVATAVRHTLIATAYSADRSPARNARHLEFWPQQFHRDQFVLHALAQPLLLDKRLKQFKGLYYQKLGQGMNVREVDRAMLAAFARYDRTKDRNRLIRDLQVVETVLKAYRPPPYTDNQFVYVAMGASISQGGGASPASQGWVYRIADRLQAMYRPLRVRNVAVGGSTTEQARKTQLPEAIACHPDLITYTAGLNDLQYGLPVDRVRENVDFTLRELRARTGAKIILTRMPQAERLPSFTLGLPKLEQRRKNVRAERVAQFNAVFEQLASKYHVKLVDIGHLWDGLASQRDIDRLFSFDGIHPNNLGHARIAELFWPVIRSAVAPEGRTRRRP